MYVSLDWFCCCRWIASSTKPNALHMLICSRLNLLCSCSIILTRMHFRACYINACLDGGCMCSSMLRDGAYVVLLFPKTTWVNTIYWRSNSNGPVWNFCTVSGNKPNDNIDGFHTDLSWFPNLFCLSTKNTMYELIWLIWRVNIKAKIVTHTVSHCVLHIHCYFSYFKLCNAMLNNAILVTNLT